MPHGRAGLHGGAAQMRQQHRVLQLQQARMHAWFFFVYIKPGRSNVPPGERRDSAASSITGPRAVLMSTAPGFMSRSRSAVDQVEGAGTTRAVQ